MLVAGGIYYRATQVDRPDVGDTRKVTVDGAKRQSG